MQKFVELPIVCICKVIVLLLMALTFPIRVNGGGLYLGITYSIIICSTGLLIAVELLHPL
jgi:hypothetical protein